MGTPKKDRATMPTMKQLLHVHGGDSLPQGTDFFDYWDNDSWVATMKNPFEAAHKKKKKWKDDLVEQLGSEWACVFPRFPNDMDAHYPEWKWWFEKHVPFMNDGVVLTGHSLGGNFLTKYLAEEAVPIMVAQLHLIAPSWSEGDFTIPSDVSLLQKQVGKTYLYFSKDDPIVPFAISEKYHAALPQAALIAFEDYGHFFAQESFPELVRNIKGSA